MKPTKTIMITAVIMGLFFLAGCEFGQPTPVYECKHEFSRWGDVEKTHDWNNGTRYIQSRKCESCGYAQSRFVSAQ